MNSHLVLERAARHPVTITRFPVLDQKLGYDKKGNSLRSLGCTLDPGQHQVDDVFGEVMLTGRDEDFRSGDRIGAIRVRHSLGLEQT